MKETLANIKKAEAMDRVLAALGTGATITAAMQSVNRDRRLFYDWCKTNPRFARDADIALEQGKNPKTNYDFVNFRKDFLHMDTYYHQAKIIEAIEECPPGGIVLILLPPEAGKGLALDTPIPILDGWTTIGKIKVGDRIYSEDGSLTTVDAVSAIHNLACYKLTFRNGASVVADSEHLWQARSTKSWQRKKTLWNTKEIFEAYETTGFQLRIPVPEPLAGEEMWLPIDPYLLGVWLGDGAASAAAFASADQEIIDSFSEQYGVRHVGGYCYSVRGGLTDGLKKLDLFGNKHIPPGYLRATVADRLALMRGLMDSDGYVDPKRGRCEFTTIKPEIRDGFMELARSLGLKPRVYEARATIGKRYVCQKYRIEIYPHLQIFRLSRKAQALQAWLDRWEGTKDTHKWETIISIEEIPSVPTRCLAVDHPSKLYVFGEQMLVTHNTTVVEDYITYAVSTDPNDRIGIIASTKEIAGKRIGRIANRLTSPEDYPLLHIKYGPFKVPGRDISKPWNKERLTVEKAHHDERDPTLEAKGAGTKLYGARWRKIILDDFQTLQDLNKTETLMRFFRQEIISRVAKTGKIIIVGTRIGPGDIYEELLKSDVIDRFVRIPAIDPFGRSYWPPAFDEKGERLTNNDGDPIGWSIEELEARHHQIGDEAWDRTYQQKASSKLNATFPETLIQAALRKDIGRDATPLLPGMMAGVDPALTRFAGFAVVNYSATQMIVVDGNSLPHLTTYQGIWDEIERLNKKWHPSDWIIEANQTQRGLARDDTMVEMRGNSEFNIIEHTTTSAKFDEKIGIVSMAGAFARGEIQIAYGDPEMIEVVAQLLTELRDWRMDVPSKMLRQDYLMALWFCYIRWLNIRKFLGQTSNSFKRQGLSGYLPRDIYTRRPVSVGSSPIT